MKKECKFGILFLLFLFLFVGCAKEWSPISYTQAFLDWNFQGEIEGIQEYYGDVEEEELQQLYQESILRFTEDVFLQDLPIEERKKARYVDVVSKIFSTMRYEVVEAEKEKDGYKVRVSIWPSDVLIRFQKGLQMDGWKLAQEIESGKYGDNQEEMEERLLSEIANRSYELLEVAFEHQRFQEKEVVEIHLKKGESKLFEIDQEDWTKLYKKILQLDKI